MTYSKFRSELASVLDKVNDDHEPIIVTRQAGKPSVVVMSLDDYNSYKETAYLMSSKRNVDRINEAIDELENKKGQRHDLIDD